MIDRQPCKRIEAKHILHIWMNRKAAQTSLFRLWPVHKLHAFSLPSGILSQTDLPNIRRSAVHVSHHVVPPALPEQVRY